jgi:hypothetical protein
MDNGAMELTLRRMAVMSADAGYYSEQVIETLERPGLQLLVPPDLQSHGEQCVGATLPERASTTD